MNKTCILWNENKKNCAQCLKRVCTYSCKYNFEQGYDPKGLNLSSVCLRASVDPKRINFNQFPKTF